MHQSQPENSGHEDRLSRRRSKLHIVAVSGGLISLGAALGVLLATSTSVFAGFGGHGGKHWDHGPVTLEHMQERAEDRLDWMLGALDATEDQSRQLKTIGLDLVTNLYPLKQQHRNHKRDIMAQLRNPNPDAAALEDLRRQELELADIASAQILAAVLKGSNILTVEQRDKIARHFRHGRH